MALLTIVNVNKCRIEVDANPMYCPSCGTEIADQSSFCPDCGAGLEAESAGSEPPSDTQLETDGIGVERPPETPTSVGNLDPNVAGALAYLFGPITGLIIFLIEERNEFVRFHAAQSLVVFGGLWILAIAVSMFSTFLWAFNGFFILMFDLLFSLIWFVVALATVILWIYLMIRAYQGETPRIPVAAGIADDLV